MQNANLPGRAQPRIKSINVEANLLNAWIDRREDAERRVKKKVLLLVALFAVSMLIFPNLVKASKAARNELNAENLKIASIDKQIEQRKVESKAAQPLIDDSAMVEKSRQQARVFFGQTLIMLNASSPRVVLAAMQAEALGGDVTIRCTADADSYTDAKAFADEISKAPGAQPPVIDSRRRSDLLAENGLTFELTQKVSVKP